MWEEAFMRTMLPDGGPDEEVIRDNVENSIILQYPDLQGILRGILIDESDWEHAVKEGYGFGNAVIDWYDTPNGHGLLEDTEFGANSGDLIAKADPNTRSTQLWNPGVERALCTLHHPDGAPYEYCSRTILANVVEEIPYNASVGTEIEFNLFENDGESAARFDSGITDIGMLYDAGIMNELSPYFQRLNDTVKRFGTKVTGFHHESGPSQFETIVHHETPVEQADSVISFREAARGVGREFNLEPTFMPRPISNEDGNGLHFHLSLWDDGDNVFYEPDDDYKLSATAYHFIGGILEHASGLTALCAPTVNSYKRLQPGLFAPVTISYGPDNRSAAIRIPPEHGESTRVELRFPDSATNPYLSLAAILTAGYHGIEEETDPGEPIDENIYESFTGETLPLSLGSALQALGEDDVLRSALGDVVIDEFIKLKENEIQRYKNTISQWEKNEYGSRF